MKFNQLTTNYAAGIDLHKTSITIHILGKNDKKEYAVRIKTVFAKNF